MSWESKSQETLRQAETLRLGGVSIRVSFTPFGVVSRLLLLFALLTHVCARPKSDDGTGGAGQDAPPIRCLVQHGDEARRGSVGSTTINWEMP